MTREARPGLPKKISVRLTTKAHEMLAAAVEASGQKVGSIVNDVLEEYLPHVLQERIEMLEAFKQRYSQATAKEVAAAARKIEETTRRKR